MHNQEPINNTIYSLSVSLQKPSKNQGNTFPGMKRFHSHNYYEIIYNSSETENTTLSFPEKSYSLTPNTFALIPRDAKHLLPESFSGERILIQMTDDYAKSVFDFLKLDINEFFKTKIRIYSDIQIQNLKKVIFEILAEFQSTTNISENGTLSFLMAQFIMLLNQSIPQASYTDIAYSGITAVQISEYLKTNYSEEITLDILADKYYVDKFIMSKNFKATTGITIMNFLTQIRLNHAKEYLEDTKLSISEIAKAVGYTSAHYLSIVFKKNMGISPSNYRLKYRNPNKTSDDVLGIDLGGTNLKVGVINKKNEIIYKETVPTENSSVESVVNQLIGKCKEVIKKYPVMQIGIAVPSTVKEGWVNTSNLPLKNTNLHKMLQAHFNIPVKLANDANCATIGECVAGTGQTTDNFLMITLGTGIGGGIIINKKLYTGKNAAGEFGMMSIDYNGEEFAPGLYGCWERYASTSALLRMAEDAANDNKDSVLYKLFSENNKLSGNLFFEALDQNCAVASKVFDIYLKNLYVGIKNLISIFDPNMVILAGGITHVGDKLLLPLLNKYKFAVPIKISELKNDAGIIGAARIQ